MAIAVSGTIPGGSAQMDQQMMDQIGVSAGSPPAGGLARMAGSTSDGYRVMSIWESEEAWDAFKRDKLEPFFKQAGRPAPTFEIWQLDTFFTASR